MKYTKEQNLELRKAVANFNKKRKRLEQKGVSPSLLPSKASVKALKLAYDNKRDLNRRLEQLNNILEKLPLREYDEVFYLMVALCDEHEKRGFLGGVRIGAKLMQELR